jgi:hypothetical protein
VVKASGRSRGPGRRFSAHERTSARERRPGGVLDRAAAGPLDCLEYASAHPNEFPAATSNAFAIVVTTSSGFGEPDQGEDDASSATAESQPSCASGEHAAAESQPSCASGGHAAAAS